MYDAGDDRCVRVDADRRVASADCRVHDGLLRPSIGVLTSTSVRTTEDRDQGGQLDSPHADAMAQPRNERYSFLRLGGLGESNPHYPIVLAP